MICMCICVDYLLFNAYMYIIIDDTPKHAHVCALFLWYVNCAGVLW